MRSVHGLPHPHGGPYAGVMGRATGSADLPLHGGRVPAWLATRMTKLGRLITEAIVIDQGRDAFMRKLAHPFWFQCFGAVMGMDWHSSGITTSVMGALKRGLKPVEHELGIYVCGGRGKHSRKTPGELRSVGERVGLDGEELGSVSRLVAKVDSAALQDGKLSIVGMPPSPAFAYFLVSDKGSIDMYKATSGNIEIETNKKEEVSGTFELGFGDEGTLSGEFAVENCVNLKQRHN